MSTFEILLLLTALMATGLLTMVVLSIERHRHALTILNKTIANAAVAQFKQSLEASGGSMKFKRLTERARGEHRGEEESHQEEAAEQEEASPA